VIWGLLAAFFGLLDWLGIPNGTRAKSIGLWHGVGNVAVVLLFGASWFLRRAGVIVGGRAQKFGVCGKATAMIESPGTRRSRTKRGRPRCEGRKPFG
jgi:hypothetical protein